MSEKVKLPKAVCDALDYAKNLDGHDDVKIVFKCHERKFHWSEVRILNDCNAYQIMRALVLGYEPELSAEERIKKLYTDAPNIRTYDGVAGYQKGIKDALRIYGIRFDWMGDVK